jgi:hypothetical protein
VKPQGFGAGGSKTPTDLSGNNLITERRMRQDVLNLEGERAKLRAEAQAMEDAVDYGSEYTPDQRARFGEIDTRLEEIDRLTQETYTRYSKLGYNPEAALNEDVSLIRFVKKPLDQITPEDVAEYDRVMAGSAPAKSGEIISFAAAFRAKNANQTPPLKPMGFGASTPKTPQQAARFETPGSPEYEAAVAKGLDMSQPAAGWRGRRRWGSIRRRCCIMGRIRKSPASAHLSAAHLALVFICQIKVELRADTASRHRIMCAAAYLTQGPASLCLKGFRMQQSLSLRRKKCSVGKGFGRRSNSMAVDAETFREVLTRSVEAPRVPEIMRRLGFDGMQGIADGHELVIFDPSNIRSVNAAFDPEKSTSSTLLAASPFAAVGGAGLTSERELGSKMADDTIRADGTKKGTGFLGPLKRPDGMTMTEYSVGVNIDGKDVEIPTLVPTLTQDEIDLLLNLPDGDKPPRAIINKAIDHARNRIKNNKSPFWNPQDDGQSTPKKKD